MRIPFSVIAAVFSVMVLFGCKSSQLATRPSGLPKITTAQLLDSVRTHSSYEFLEAKLNVNHSTAEKTQSFGVRMRMKKDSIIWLSITPGLGIEAVRVVITPDSIQMVNRIEQKYFSESFSKTNEVLKLEVSFELLQSALTGEFVRLYDEGMYLLKPLVDLYTLDANTELIASSDAPLKLEQRTEIDPKIWRVTRSILRNPKRNEHILAEYYDFQQLETMIFPTSMRFRTQGKENIAVELNWSKIEEKTTLRFPFNIPSKYVAY
jgi:hypothetical protein